MIYSSGWNYVTVSDSLGCIANDSVFVNVKISGCTDSTAINYNPFAQCNDSKCCYIAGYRSSLQTSITMPVITITLVNI